MKTCTKCGRRLPLSDFGNHRLTKDKLAYRCKDCAKQHTQQYNQTPVGIYNTLKRNAKFNSHKPLDLSRDEFIEWYNGQERFCVYCDIKEKDLFKINDSMNNTAQRLTVDCMDNKTGYVIGNLVLSCRRCNNQKSDLFTFDEWYGIAQQYLKPKWAERIKDDK